MGRLFIAEKRGPVSTPSLVAGLFSRVAFTTTDEIESRLLKLAALFLFIQSLALSLSPAVRARSWQVSYRWDHWLGFALWLGIFSLAHVQAARHLPRRDPYLLPIGALLSGLGLLTIWRLLPGFGFRQGVWLAIAVGVLVLGLRLPNDLAIFRRYKYLWLVGSLLLTFLTLLLGASPTGNGPRMWLGCCNSWLPGGIYLQPSEPLKLLLIAYLAAYMADHLPLIQSSDQVSSTFSRSIAPLLSLLAPTLILTGLALVVLLIQRDLGTASIFLFLYAAIVYVTTGRRRILLIALLGLALAGLAGYWFFDVVRVRVDAWLNPWLDPSGRSFQIIQALMAIANGGLLGRGIGLGNPGLVPVAHSDLIYSAIGEEYGLAGAIGLLLLISILASRGLTIALNARDTYRRYLAAGLTTYLVVQGLLIMGGNLRLLPLTGVTLPFISYGGSSLLVSFLSLLLLLHVSNRSEKPAARLWNPRPYLQLGGVFLVGLAVVSLATGWWAIYRSQGLLSRTDNPRRAISDRFVRRGSILDRANQPINVTTGEPGDYVRRYSYADLSNVVGYNDPAYGQSGLEASLDDTLRGLKGNPGLSIWWNHLLYGQPPPGLNVRLSLDLDLQQEVDALMEGHRGALVALNAVTGEILAMSSHPSFDANDLDGEWKILISESGAPLLNRAIQGRYPLGALNELIPGGLKNMVKISPPTLSFPLMIDWGDNESISTINPLQMAMTAGVISSGGLLPSPRIVLAVDTSQAGWVILSPTYEPPQVLDPDLVDEIIAINKLPDMGIWQKIEVLEDSTGQENVWYLGGTIPGQDGDSYAISLLLEEGNKLLVESIGRAVLDTMITP
jgi:cell division protein FtsW (lipid II flippase)